MVFSLPGGMALPVQYGPATEYARQKRGLLFLILLAQVLLMAFRLIFSLDIFGALFMALQVAIGGYAWQQDMNITYLSLYGIICLINAIFSGIAAIIPILWNFVTLDFFSCVSACFLPVADAAGAYLSWLIYNDFSNTQKGLMAMPQGMPQQAGMFGGMGGMFAASEAQPFGKGADGRSMFSGTGYTLGSTPNPMQQAQGMFSGLTTPAGRHDVTYDPFMTRSA